MKIELAKSSGFCVGVKRAIKIALETAARHQPVYMLGNIVHNEEVSRQLNKVGIKKIKTLTRTKGSILLIRAHGIALKELIRARRLGYKIVDATCPMVKEIHQIARRMEARGYRIIIIGDQKHDEVKGISGRLKQKALVISGERKLPLARIKKINQAAVVVQSTQNLDNALKIAALLKKHIRKLKFHNTICRPTRTKQEEIKRLALQNDLIVVIGSKTSANTKRLFQIAHSLNKNSYWVESSRELKPGWFKGKKKAAVISGASTPQSTTRAVVNSIRKL